MELDPSVVDSTDAAAGAKSLLAGAQGGSSLLNDLEVEVIRRPSAADAALMTAGAGSAHDGTLVLAKLRKCNAAKVSWEVRVGGLAGHEAGTHQKQIYLHPCLEGCLPACLASCMPVCLSICLHSVWLSAQHAWPVSA